MPKRLEKKLKKEAKEKGFSKEKSSAYIYGTLRKIGWKPNKEKK